MLFIKIFLIIILFQQNSLAAIDYTKSDETGFKLFKTVLDIIKNEYVEELSTKKILSYAVQGMLPLLDPHSCYLTQKEYEEMKVSTSGEFGGLGLEIGMDNNIIKVISPYDDGPAFKSGIKAGDYIVAIEGKSVKGMSLKDVSDKLKGDIGTKVALKIYRETIGIIDLIITRDLVRVTPVKSKVVSNSSIAYIKISMFNDKTAKNTKQEWDNIYKKNPTISGLILDLRSNPGGLLKQATEIADLFLSEGDIVIIKSRKESDNQIFKADKEDITNGMPIVVLINHGSASAAEIVAGALQDNGRALILGTSSFGKGSVQKIIPLIDKSAIKMTTALYYTPSGKSIQADGIIPDIVVPDVFFKAMPGQITTPISESSLKGHIKSNSLVVKEKNLSDNDSNYINSITENEEIKDFQLTRAIDVIKTMALYSKKFLSY